MIDHYIATRYAKVLFNNEKEKDILEQRVESFTSLLRLLKANQQVQNFLESPVIDSKEKETVLRENSGIKDNIFLDFLSFLIKNKRCNYLPAIAQEYRRMAHEYLGIWEAQLKTAIPIQEGEEMILIDKISHFFHRKIIFSKIVDPKIIGGVILLMGNRTIDWSIVGRLEKLKEHLLKPRS